jgi:predicted GH43/DUF377 family glycosyl hydrolase
MSVQRWQSLGLVYRPDPSKPWMRHHAQNPAAVSLGGAVWRVFFASRDERNRSQIGWFDIDLDRPQSPMRAAAEPVVALGPLGHFDGDGVYPSCAVRDGTRIRLYTIGWNAGLRPPMFYAAIGLAVSEDAGATFRRHGQIPVLTRSEHDPCFVSGPMVLHEGGRWRMWYISGYRWIETADGLNSHYHIKYAESDDGIAWRRDGRVCVAHASADETNISRACVVNDGGRYRAWYSFKRGDAGYRIGYAESRDGLDWTRQDDIVDFRPSGAAWDADAQAYPYVVKHGGRWFMFYNGIGFGRDGVGVAVADF